MTGEKFFYLIAFIISCSAQTCPIYTTKQLTSPLCIEYDSGIYSVSPCDPKSATPYCPPLTYNPATGTITSECTAAPTPPSTTGTLYPGEKYNTATDCFSGITNKGYCKGNGLGGSCSNHAFFSANVDCDAGYYCNYAVTPSVCAPLIPPFAQCETGECTYGHGCYNGICLPYRIIENGEAVISSYCLGNTSPFCEDGQCYVFPNTTAVCISDLKSSQSIPTECTSSSGCQSKVSKEIGIPIFSACNCGYNPNGLSYCSTFLGEGYTEKFRKLLEKWDDNKNMKHCNIDIAYSYKCVSSYTSKKTSAEFLFYGYMSSSQISLTDALPEVQTIYLQDYLTDLKIYESSTHKSSSFARILGISIMIISIFI